MTILQELRSSIIAGAGGSMKNPWWRSLVLCVLLFLSILLYVVLFNAAPQRDDLITPFLQIEMICFLPYFAACAFVLATKPVMGRWRWIELGIILVGALILRGMLLPLPPGLSHDSWRYLWDARVLLHGYSPYVFAPGDKMLAPLRDALIFGNSRFRNVPTIYPPGAQAVYVLSYLLAPSNLFFLKGLFVGFDMVTCGALAVLLARKGLDPRRVVIYAWCPLPIVEFAIQGHVDVITLTFTVLALLFATSNSPAVRVWVGIIIGIGTLTKIYPILLLVVVLRRRDWALLIACCATILLGYLPFLILGHGQASGFFLAYASEQGQNAGPTQRLIIWVCHQLGLSLAATLFVEHIVDLAVVCTVSLVMLVLRQRERISMEMATLWLLATVLSISSHVFPWYTTALLPWIVMLGGPLWVRHKGSLSGHFASRNLAVVAFWYFTTTSLLGYFFNGATEWALYYELVYDVTAAGLIVAAIVGGINLCASKSKRGQYVP